MDDLFIEVGQISELIEQIKNNVRDVKKIHNIILTASQTDNSECENRVQTDVYLPKGNSAHLLHLCDKKYALQTTIK